MRQSASCFRIPEPIICESLDGPRKSRSSLVIEFAAPGACGRTNPLDRRRQIRFGLRAHVFFAWTDRDGVPHKGQGFTRDISSHGVYIHAEGRAPMERDTEIDINILLPSSFDTHRTLHMSGRAKVIRVEAAANDKYSGGFVAESESYVLLDEQNQER